MPSLSAFYAGGQTVNTAEELFRFHRALIEGELASEERLQKIQQWNKLWQGIDYGYGIVRIRPLPFLILVAIRNERISHPGGCEYLYEVIAASIKRFHSWGGLGASSAFMVYNPIIDVYVIGTFNQWSYIRKSMMFLLRTMRSISKVERPGQ